MHPEQEADMRACEQITYAHARTFSLASRLLVPEKRRAAYALYAFCRIADDLVDRCDEGNRASFAEQLADYRAGLQAALDGRPSGAIFREISRVVTTFSISPGPLFELLDGVSRDLVGTTYATWSDLEAYCQGVASSVGEMCTDVFGVVGGPSSRPHAVAYARTLGVAMQLTNILRDVGEDSQRGRCYLPLDDLARAGFTPDDVLQNPTLSRDARWQGLMQFEIARARDLYAAATPGIALLEPDARRCATACATGYAGILDAIEARRYDTISARARVGKLARVGILWNAWRLRPEPVA
jgi:phytoene synthase